MMEWRQIWRVLFSGWDGDIDLAALAAELHRLSTGDDERDAAAWVCEQIQEAY
jgi:hypothetical protein